MYLDNSINVIRLHYHEIKEFMVSDSFEASKARDAGVIRYFYDNLQPKEQLDFIQVTGVDYYPENIATYDNYVALTSERLYLISIGSNNGKYMLKKGILPHKTVSQIKLQNIDSITYTTQRTNKRKKYSEEERKYTIKSKNENDDKSFYFFVDEDNYALFDKQVEKIYEKIQKVGESSKEEPMLDKLERLANLFRERLISQEEFEKAKKILLGIN